MVALLSLLRAGYWLCLLLAAGLVLTPAGPYVVPVLLIVMLGAHIALIPGFIAWSRSYGALLLDAIVTICFIIAMYGFLFFEAGMESEQPTTLLDAMRYSLGVWANNRPDGFAVENVWPLSTIEALTSYFALALVVALLIIWVQEAAESGKEYMQWLGRQSPEDIERITGRKIPTPEQEEENKAPHSE